MSISGQSLEVHPHLKSPSQIEIFSLFRLILTDSQVRLLERKEEVTRYRDRIPIFTTIVVIWSMIFQRLDSKHTLSSVVKGLRAGKFCTLHGRKWKNKCATMSLGTSGYSQARTLLPVSLVAKAVDLLISGILQLLEGKFLWNERRVFLFDGSTLSAGHHSDILKRFPAGSNQLGTSYWPVIEVLVAHDLLSGVATCPCWGAMYGKAATSEQALFKQQIKRLPAGSIVIGDSNFGIFAVVHHSICSAHDVVFRLTNSRVNKILGRLPKKKGDIPVTWEASKCDISNNPEIKDANCLSGRVITITVKRHTRKAKPFQIHLFTTLKHNPEKIAQLYLKRYYIETDLRTIKATVHMEILSSKSLPMLEKELLIGVAAYSLVRAVMAFAAHKAGVPPRSLSFSYTLDVIRANLPRLQFVKNAAQLLALAQQILEQIALCPIHKRKKKRKNQPRILRPRGKKYPVTLASRNELNMVSA